MLKPVEYLKSGSELVEQSRLDEATALYRQAIQTYPNNARLHRAFATLQRQQNNPAGAIASYRKSIDLQPDSPAEIYLTLGQMLLDRNQLKQAVEVGELATKQHPNDALLHRFLGLAQRKGGNLKSATAAYRRSLELNPQQPAQIYLTLGQLLTEQNLLEEAVELYQQSSQLYPNDAEIYRSLGIVQGKQGHRDGEVASYLAAIRLEPRQPVSLYLTLGSVFLKCGQLEEAVALYQQAIALYPNKADLYRALGFAQEKMGNLESGIAHYQKAIELQPKQPAWLYLILSHLLTERGELEAAIDVCKALAQVDPTAYEAHQKILNILLAEQRMDEVFAYIEQVFQDEPSGRIALIICGHTLLKQGEFSQAETFFKLAVEKYPASYEGYEGLALVSESRGLSDQAKQYWQECFSRFEQHPLHSVKDVAASVNGETSSTAVRSEPTDSAAQPAICPELDDPTFITFCFVKLLHRNPSQESLEKAVAFLSRRSRVDYLIQLLDSEEANQKRSLNLDLLPDYQDEAFVEFIVAITLGIKASQPVKEHLLKLLSQGNLRSTIALKLLEDPRLKESAEQIVRDNQPSRYYPIGKKEAVSVSDWYRKFAQNAREYWHLGQRSHGRVQQVSLQSRLAEPHYPLVSIITSLYNGDEFIENFMQHICEQSIFVQNCELIIIDADSPGCEYECIQRYCEQYKNIFYYRLDERVTIYQAWNIAAQKAKGLFLTNANVDDIRRFDCLEQQARELIEHPQIDVVYPDYAYSLEPNLPFELVCLEGHQTSLPVADRENLLMFNSPHCGPMWRKSLHESIGFFDESFKSAGDLEFWMRASSAGHRFGKIEQCLIAYYLNPNGLSTDDEGFAKEEVLKVVEQYQSLRQ